MQLGIYLTSCYSSHAVIFHVFSIWLDFILFPAPNGDFLSRSTVYQNFKKVAAAAGLPRMRVHDLRHVFAMLALSSGVDVSSVQDALGHKDAEVTLQIYAYVNDETRKKAAEKMQEAFASLRASGQ